MAPPAEEVHYCCKGKVIVIMKHHQVIMADDIAINITTWPPTSDDFSVAFGHSSLGGIITSDVTLTGVPGRATRNKLRN